MTQAFTAPVSGAAQAAATRTARTSPGGSGPPGTDHETPAFSSVLDHHVARTAHAEGQHKTTGDSGGRRSSHGHGAGKGHHSHRSHKSASADPTATQARVDQAQSVSVRANAVQAAAPAAGPAPPTPAETATTAQSTLVSLPATPAQPPASSAGDAGQPTAAGSAQTTNFIPATVKPASAPVAAATPGVDPTAADQLSESGTGATADTPTLAATQTPAAAHTPAAQAPATDTEPVAPSAPAPQQTAAVDGSQSPSPSPGPAPATDATGATGQSQTSTLPAPTDAVVTSAPTTAPHGKPAAPAHSDDQAQAPTVTSADPQPQAPNASPQDAGQNGSGAQPQPSPAHAPLHAQAADTQSQPTQASTPAPTTPAPTPGMAPAPAPQTAPVASPAATAAATGPARYGIGLSEAVETVATTIELGSRQGFSQAKIQLAPATLGQITIHLQKTSDGIVAKVVADHSAAAQTMQQGGDDLRRSLQNSGLHLLRLDIETRGDQRGSANAGQNAPSSDRRGEGQESAAGDDGASRPTTLVLPNGALVNVLA
jgi:flagellar hook-length control protein FliK